MSRTVDLYPIWMLALIVGAGFSLASSPPLSAASFEVTPQQAQLDDPEATLQLLASAKNASGRTMDVTRVATYRSKDDSIATVDALGLIQPLRDGTTAIIVSHDGATIEVPVNVLGVDKPQAISFPRDIVPILTKSACNTGGCHGKAEGQNGFKLSVFGFDPVSDHEATTMQARGRRVFLPDAERSLILLKATATEPHGGGQRLERDSLRYRRLKAAGLPKGHSTSRKARRKSSGSKSSRRNKSCSAARAGSSASGPSTQRAMPAAA